MRLQPAPMNRDLPQAKQRCGLLAQAEHIAQVFENAEPRQIVRAGRLILKTAPTHDRAKGEGPRQRLRAAQVVQERHVLDRRRVLDDLGDGGKQGVRRIDRASYLGAQAPAQPPSDRRNSVSPRPVDDDGLQVDAIGARGSTRSLRKRDRASAPDKARRRRKPRGAIGKPHPLLRCVAIGWLDRTADRRPARAIAAQRRRLLGRERVTLNRRGRAHPSAQALVAGERGRFRAARSAARAPHG